LAATSSSATPTLELVKVTPASGSAVTRQTAVVAALRYEIPNFVAGQYRLTAQFETTTPGATYDGAFPNISYPIACATVGTFSIYFPLEYMWEVQSIKRPIRMIFYLLEGTGRIKRIVAKSEWIHYSSTQP
jgi:hypothetical protein